MLSQRAGQGALVLRCHLLRLSAYARLFRDMAPVLTSGSRLSLQTSGSWVASGQPALSSAVSDARPARDRGAAASRRCESSKPVHEGPNSVAGSHVSGSGSRALQCRMMRSNLGGPRTIARTGWSLCVASSRLGAGVTETNACGGCCGQQQKAHVVPAVNVVVEIACERVLTDGAGEFHGGAIGPRVTCA